MNHQIHITLRYLVGREAPQASVGYLRFGIQLATLFIEISNFSGRTLFVSPCSLFAVFRKSHIFNFVAEESFCTLKLPNTVYQSCERGTHCKRNRQQVYNRQSVRMASNNQQQKLLLRRKVFEREMLSPGMYVGTQQRCAAKATSYEVNTRQKKRANFAGFSEEAKFSTESFRIPQPRRVVGKRQVE